MMSHAEIKQKVGKKMLRDFVIDSIVTASLTIGIYVEVRSVNLAIGMFFLVIMNMLHWRRLESLTDYKKSHDDSEKSILNLIELLEVEKRRRIAELRPESLT